MASAAPSLADIDPRVLEILRRRPRLILVLVAVSEMVDGRRNCRVSVDISDGVVRVFREVQERSVTLVETTGQNPTG